MYSINWRLESIGKTRSAIPIELLEETQSFEPISAVRSMPSEGSSLQRMIAFLQLWIVQFIKNSRIRAWKVFQNFWISKENDRLSVPLSRRSLVVGAGRMKWISIYVQQLNFSCLQKYFELERFAPNFKRLLVTAPSLWRKVWDLNCWAFRCWAQNLQENQMRPDSYTNAAQQLTQNQLTLIDSARIRQQPWKTNQWICSEFSLWWKPCNSNAIAESKQACHGLGKDSSPRRYHR